VIPALLILVLLCIAPVSAASIDITVNGSISNWALNPGTENTNADMISINVTTTGITSSWNVYVKDANDNSKPPSWSGRMVEYDGTNYVTDSPHVLGTNVSVIDTGGSGYSGGTATLGPIDQPILTGNNNVSEELIPITIDQITSYTDPHLTTANHVYRIIVTFTGTAS
jgi:hypothetical protein